MGGTYGKSCETVSGHLRAALPQVPTGEGVFRPRHDERAVPALWPSVRARAGLLPGGHVCELFPGDPGPRHSRLDRTPAAPRMAVGVRRPDRPGAVRLPRSDPVPLLARHLDAHRPAVSNRSK